MFVGGVEEFLCVNVVLILLMDVFIVCWIDFRDCDMKVMVFSCMEGIFVLVKSILEELR